jgi:hypothetical protein
MSVVVLARRGGRRSVLLDTMAHRDRRRGDDLAFDSTGAIVVSGFIFGAQTVGLRTGLLKLVKFAGFLAVALSFGVRPGKGRRLV